MYRRFELDELPPARREAVLELRLEAWNPMPDARFWTGWQRGVAHVWAWYGSDPELQAGVGEIPVPETVVQIPGGNGPRLVAGLDGYEGQLWRNAKLVQSRWWARSPDESAWHAFLRAAGQPPGPVPAPQTPAWQQRPWARSSTAARAWFERHERRLVATTAGVFALFIGWQLGALWKVDGAVEQARERLEALQQRAGDELAARERALAASARAEALLALRPTTGALALFDEVTGAMPSGTRLREWQHEPGELTFMLQAESSPDPEQAVRAFESVSTLDEVIVERGRPENSLEVRAAIVEAGAAG